ncbi:hypothetical protein GWI33_003459 [Rhynchophorus ferrugineus]|uniref:Uncharacterized protein n=1 Tax=Rhynchophorus ferrugineus TaxID=354439 RepID=A0A834IJD1_RHYFE|nr:hypothetical protein GWI33_003459 [Rhynchophorus ferrugineus]
MFVFKTIPHSKTYTRLRNFPTESGVLERDRNSMINRTSSDSSNVSQICLERRDPIADSVSRTIKFDHPSPALGPSGTVRVLGETPDPLSSPSPHRLPPFSHKFRSGSRASGCQPQRGPPPFLSSLSFASLMGCL